MDIRIYNITCPNCGYDMVIHQQGFEQEYVDLKDWTEHDYASCFKVGGGHGARCAKQYKLTFTGVDVVGIDFEETS